MKNKKTIYELLVGYKKEDIDKAIESLSDEDKKIIEKRYNNTSAWTEEDAHYYYRSLIPKLKRILNKMKKRPKLIYEYFNGYSKDDINEAIKHLKDEYKKVLTLRYGKDLENPVMLSDAWTKNHIIMFHNHILVDIQKYLDYKTTSRKIKTIYDLLSEFSKDEINEALIELSDSDKSLLKIKYGENLESPSTSKDWNPSMNKVLHLKLIPKIRKIIKKNIKNIYEYFPDYSIEQVDEAIKLLDDKTKAQLIICFNYDKIHASVEGIKRNKGIEKHIVERIIIRLEKLYGGKKIKTIYDYFPNNTKEEVNEAIKFLPNKDREIIFLKYNGNLEGNIKSLEWNSKYSSMFYEIIRKLKRILKGHKLHAETIYDYFRNISEEILNAILIGLTFEEKELIYLRYGKDLHKPQKSAYWSNDISDRFDLLLRRLETKIKNTEEFEEVLIFEDDFDYQKIIKADIARKYESKTDDIKGYPKDFGADVQIKLIDLLDDLEYQIISLRYLENFTIEDIAFILIMDQKEVIRVLKKAMYLYKLERLKEINNNKLNTDLKRVRTKKDSKKEE